MIFERFRFVLEVHVFVHRNDEVFNRCLQEAECFVNSSRREPTCYTLCGSGVGSLQEEKEEEEEEEEEEEDEEEEEKDSIRRRRKRRFNKEKEKKKIQ